MKKATGLFFLCILSLTLAAQRTKQEEKVDSLQKVLTVTKEDTTRVMVYLTLASWYETNNQDTSAYYLDKGKKLAEQIKFERGIYYAYQQGAVLSFTKGNYDEAMVQSVKGLALARKLKDSASAITMLNNIGIIEGYYGNFKQQLEYSLQVRDAVIAIKDSSKLSGVYHNLANCYQYLTQYRKAIETAQYSIYLYTQLKLRNDYINRVYATLAQSYELLNYRDSALYNYNIAIRESIRLNDKYAEGIIYGYMVNLFANMNRYNDMLDAAEKSLALAKELQSRQMTSSALYNVAYAHLLNNNQAEAKKEINESLAIATADSLKDELKNGYSVLSYIAAREGDFKTSVWAKKKTDSIQEATLNEQVIRSSEEMEKKYESAKKDNQLSLQRAALQKKNILNYILIGGLAILLLISLLGYYTYKQKQKLQQQRIAELETQQQLTATEAVLKGEEQERTRLAKDLHDGLGGMLSGIKYSFNTMKGNLVMTPENAQAFERSMDMLDSSIKEMRRVAHNMMPEALVKFGLDTALKDFCNDINNSGALQVSYQSIGLQDLEIDQTVAITIYRIVQELINNTMKHAAAKTAVVQVTKSNQQLSVTVEDDGKGFDTALLQQGKGIGWSNIHNRVEFLKGNLDVQSGNDKGTSVHIEINIE